MPSPNELIRLPEFVVDFQPLVITGNTVGTKIMTMVPGGVGRAGLKVQCEFGKWGEKGQM